MNLWEAYEEAIHEVLHLPDGSPQQSDASARCHFFANQLRRSNDLTETMPGLPI